MDKTTKISVIVPAYNYGNFLGECLESVRLQTYPNWECVIVDNGSTDNTAEVAKGFVNKDTRFRYVHTEQNGVSFARNKAVEVSKGDFILPLDADDKIAPAYLEKAEVILRAQPSVKVVYCEAELFGAASGAWHLPVYSFKNLLIENSIFCTALFRKSDLAAAGGYDTNMREGFEDWDFWIRMLKSGGDVYRIPEVLFYYRIKPASRNSVLDEQKQLQLRRRIFENHKAIYESTFALPDLIFANYKMEKELENLKQSASFKTGKIFLAPVRFFMHLFKR